MYVTHCNSSSSKDCELWFLSTLYHSSDCNSSSRDCNALVFVITLLLLFRYHFVMLYYHYHSLHYLHGARHVLCLPPQYLLHCCWQCVCLCSISCTAAGNVRTHGPLSSCCQGYGLPPRQAPPRTELRANDSTSPVTLPLPPGSMPSLSQHDSYSMQGIPPVRVLKFIPKTVRDLSTLKLSSILDDIVCSNTPQAWECLFLFPSHCLRVPESKLGGQSLTSRLKEQLLFEQEPIPTSYQCASRRPHRRPLSEDDRLKLLSKKVSEKLEEGDISGAVTLAALQSKHPLPPSDATIPSPPSPSPGSISIDELDVERAIGSFSILCLVHVCLCVKWSLVMCGK